MRTAILRGTFKPGEKLDQQQISADLGVSPSPVRQALRTLAAEGLVTIIPNRGATVTERSIEELEELQFIRRMLEGAAARRGAPRMDDSRLESLAAILDKAEKTSDFEEILALNNEFHAAIYSAFPQPTLMRHIQQLRNRVAPYNRVYLESAGSKEVALAGHRRIYEACIRRDGKQAEEETSKHLEQVFLGTVKLTQSTANN
ncbi:MAG TPA: GntR family transcriptional regulator [Anaerolineae bacterium]|nr:GntR family transcriptional regulator [Anaerolineae bacterium]